MLYIDYSAMVLLKRQGLLTGVYKYGYNRNGIFISSPLPIGGGGGFGLIKEERLLKLGALVLDMLDTCY